MVSLKNAVLAVGLAVGIVQQTEACRCMQREICDVFEEAVLVVHASPFARDGETEPGVYSNDPVSYAMTTIETFKGDQIDSQRLTITTAGSSAACGVYMELGQEYLLGLYRDGDGQFAANTCFLFRSWGDLTKEELTLLANGCTDDDDDGGGDGCDDDAAALVPNGCDDTCGGRCGEFQDCVFYEQESEYYCTDFCDPDRCPEGEACALQNVLCVRSPCPPLAICLDEDPCRGTCAETQTCVQYLQSEKYYCSDE